MKKEIIDNDYILNIVTDIREYNRTIEDLEKDYPDKIKEIENALLDYMCEIDPKILKDEFGNKWKNLTKKLAYTYEFFNGIDDYQKPVKDLKKEDFFSKFKNKCPKEDEIARTMEIIKLFLIENGDELTQLYLKSDVLLLACVFEKFIKVRLAILILTFFVLVYLVILGNVD